MKQRLNIVTAGDVILMGSLIVLAVLSIIFPFTSRPPGAFAMIECENRPVRRVDLSLDQIVSVAGPLGETLVEVRSGSIRIKQSPCPHQTCMKMGFREKSGEVIACIPNRIVVKVVSGEKGNGVDGISR